MAKMVKVSVSVDKTKLRAARALAKSEGVSLSAVLTRGLQHELDARSRLAAAIELYGSEDWPTEEERRAIVASWTAGTPKRRRSRAA